MTEQEVVYWMVTIRDRLNAVGSKRACWTAPFSLFISSYRWTLACTIGGASFIVLVCEGRTNGQLTTTITFMPSSVRDNPISCGKTCPPDELEGPDDKWLSDVCDYVAGRVFIEKAREQATDIERLALPIFDFIGWKAARAWDKGLAYALEVDGEL